MIDDESGGVDEPITDSHNKLGVCDSECEVLKGSVNFTGTNFTSLQEEISNCHDGDTIYLKNNVIQDGNSPITISKSLTIIGNGYTIDANNVSRIFYINEKVNFKDITFINGYADVGGAIYNYDGEAIISNCTFINNTATNEGGAVYSSIDDNLFVTDSYFINNSARLCGGAISTRGRSEIVHVSFINNSATSGGAIYNRGAQMIAQNLIFSNNSADEGGAVYNSDGGEIRIDYVNFTNNSAVKFGGAISNSASGDFAMEYANFIKNTAKYGGAISNFGTFYFIFYDVPVNTFSQNTAQSNGGAVYNGNDGVMYVRGSILTQNSGIYGESIYNNGDLQLEENNDTNFIYNDNYINSVICASFLDGENVFVYSLDETLYPFAALIDDNGNAIYDKKFKIYVNNKALQTNFDKNTKLYTTSFTPSDYGEYVVNNDYYAPRLLIDEGRYVISKKGSFSDLQNLIDYSDGILNLTYNFTYDFEFDGDKFPDGVVINKTITINGNGYAISGNNSNRIFNVSSDVILNNVSLVNGNSDDFAGAIYIGNGYVTLANSSFINNSAESAGAIYFDSDNDLIIINSTFIKNKARGEFTYGGSIYVNRSNLLMNNSRFIENNGYSGAAVYNLGAMTITNCNFTDNIFGWGVIYNKNEENSFIKNSIFMANYGVSGSAIFNYKGTLTIDRTNIKDNIAYSSAGVIYDGSYACLIITNSNFTNNTGIYGGAIFIMEDGDVRIINSTFIENNGHNGETIYSYGKLYLENNYISSFIYHDDGVINPDITSKVYLNLINGSTCIEYFGKTLYPFATLTDDNGNAIYDANLSIYVNNNKLDTIFNSTTKTYYATFNPLTYGEYNVSAQGYHLSNLTINYGKYFIVKKGSLYELNALIQACDGILELPYNFTYDSEVDWLLGGIVLLDKDISIEGNGYTIDANMTQFVFNIIYDRKTLNFNLNNLSFINIYSGSWSIFGGYDTKFVFNNCQFKSNKADNGILWFSYSTVTMNNCKFIDNTVESFGGLINYQSGDLIINNSLFWGNSVMEHVGILYNLGNTSIFNSNFTNLIDYRGYSIYNSGSLYLENNCLSDMIYNDEDGEIISEVVADFINGENVVAYFGENVYPFAKLTDSDGNVIHDGRFAIYLNNVKLETEFNRTSGIYNATFCPDRYGNYNVTTRYSSSNLTLTTGQYSVVKKGTYSDLKLLMDLSDGIIELNHDFEYSSQYDGDKFPNGIEINKDITIDGKNHYISGNCFCPIFYISDGDVTLNNITFRDSSSVFGGAICNYANLTVTNSQFTDNQGENGGAICNYDDLTLINSTFIRNEGLRNESILNSGTLFLENNSVSNVIFNKKIISSRVNVELIDGKTIYKYVGQTDYPFARLTDDNGNLILDLYFRICLNDIQLVTEFNQTTGLYNAEFTFDVLGRYDVNFIYGFYNFTVTPGAYIVVKPGSFSELEGLIIQNDVLDLKYDFAYDFECDCDKFPEGIVISKNITIEGNGYSIEGNNSHRIFYIDGDNVSLNNINFINGSAEFGGAIFNNGNLTITDSNFINNTAASDDSIYNLKTLFLRNNNVSNIIFNRGNITSRVYADFIRGETIYLYLGETVYPFAELRDDNGNIINDENFNIYLNNVKFETSFNKTTNMYNTTFALVNSGSYLVRTEYGVNVSINSGMYVVVKKGSYSDLQNLIDWTDNNVLNLEYDFSYDFECDQYKFPEGVIIDKIIYINGQGHVLSGNNSYRLFSINAADVILFNMTLVNGTASNGGAIVNEGNLTLASVDFIQNSAKNLGGALYNDNGSILLLGDFIENSALKNGGAIYNLGGNISIGNSLFEKNTAKMFGGALYNDNGSIQLFGDFIENSALKSGGAIYNLGGNISVNNALFEKNTAKMFGGAIENYIGVISINASQFEDNVASIYGGAIDNSLGEIFIYASQFEDNVASAMGDGIYNNFGDLTLTNSVFTQNVKLDSMEIYNDGSLSLENNTILNIIYNVNSITSTVKAILINGENITGYLNETYILFATLTDDNGNAIYDHGVVITVNGSEVETAYNPETRLYTATFTPADLGDYIINTSFESEKLVIVSGKYTIVEWQKLNPTIGIEVNPIDLGDNLVVLVKADGESVVNASGKLNVTIEGLKSFIINVSDGRAIINPVLLPKLPGNYIANLNYSGDKYYNEAIGDVEFTINKVFDVEIIVPSNVTIDNELIINVTGAKDGILNVTISDGEEFSADVVNGFAYIPGFMLPQSSGLYDIAVKYWNGSYFADKELDTTFHADKITDYIFDISYDTILFGENASISIDLPGDVNVNDFVVLINQQPYTVNITDGYAILENITDLPVGKNDVEARFESDKYETSYQFSYVEVDPNHLSFDIIVPSKQLHIGDDADITVRANVSLNAPITVYINGRAVNKNLTNGVAELTISPLLYHEYLIAVAFEGNENYTSCLSQTVSFNVDDAVLDNTTVDVDIKTFENNVTITVNVNPNATGFIQFNVSGPQNFTVYLAVGDGKAILEDVLAVGDYKAIITYLGDSNFNVNSTTEEFTIVGHIKKDTEIIATPSVDSRTVTISIGVDESATGFATIGVLGQVFIVPVNDGKAVFVFDFVPGTYSAEVVYLGDENFNNASTNISFTVTEEVIDLKNTTISADVEVFENDVTITVTVDSLASGLVEFNIGGEAVYLPVNNGKAVCEFVLPAGEYNVDVTYMGDSKFNPNSTSKEFSVVGHVKKNTTITSDVVVDGYNVTVTVNVNPNATGFIELTLKGESIYAQIKDGKIVLNAYFEPGNYTMLATYLGDENFNINTTLINFIVDDIPLKNTTIDANIVIVDNNVTITVNVDKEATGLIKFDVSGAENYTVYVDIVGGKAILEDVLAAGDYKAIITYLGDENFNMNTTSEEFTVTGHIKKDTEIKAVPNVESTTVTITVIVDEDATGYVAIGVLGQIFIVPVDGGKAVFVYDFFPGTYSANVVYLGDDNFNNASTTASFTVIENKTELKNTTIDVDVDSVENNVTIAAVVDSLASGLVEFNIDGKSVYIAVTNGVAVYNAVLPAGEYNAIVNYLGDGKFNPNSTSKEFTVVGHVKKNTTITSDVVVDGFNVTIAVDLNSEATGFIEFILAGNSIFVQVNDGKAVFNSYVLPGNYTIDAIYLGDDDFNTNSTVINFIVDEIPLKNTTIDADVVIVDNNVTITVSVDEDATGLIKFDVSGAENYTVYMDIAGGKAILEDVLAAGDYKAIITYLGDDNFNRNTTTEEFTVVGHIKKDTSISTKAVVENYTVTITADVDKDATGNVIIGVLGQNFIVPVANGKAVFTYDFFPGTYGANVVYLGDDNFNNASTTVSFTVTEEVIDLKNTTITVDVDAVENNVTIKATVDTLASGLVEFNIGGKSVYIAVNNGVAVYNAVLPAGEYNAIVNYLGDGKFNPNSTSKEFTVVGHVKKNTTITSEVVVDGFNVTITVGLNSEVSGFVEFVLGGNSIFAQVNDGKAVFNSYVLQGNYTIDAIYLGDDDFNTNATVINFIVDEIPLKNTTIDADVVIVDNNITITVNIDKNASGFVEFNVSGAENYTVYVAVDDGKAILEDVLTTGDYKAVITYLGDDYFNRNTTAEEFSVVGHIKKDTKIKAVPNVESSTVTITVSVDGDATGHVAIGVLGQNFIVPVKDGKAVFVYDFFPGTYSANVVYLGDDNFNNASTTTSFTVIEHKTELKNTTIDVDVDAVENNVTITANVDVSATGLVEFNIGGESVYIAVNNGVAVYNAVLPAGDYNAVVNYLGDNKFNPNSTSKEFTVVGHVKRNTTITFEVVVDGFNVTITVGLNPEVTGFVEFVLGGNSIFAQVNAGKAVFNSYVLPGNYTIDAIYLGDDDFNTNSTVINFIVDEIPLKNTTIDADVVIVDNNVTITVSVDEDATGLIKFDVSGAENYTVYVDVVDGKAILEDVLAAGDYKAIITYLGDVNFNMNTTSEEFSVVGHIKKDTEIKAVPSVESTTVTITVSVDEDATGHVAIGVLGQNFIVPVKYGKAVFVYDFFPGTYSANVVYLGDDNFNNASTTTSFTVIEHKTELKNTTITVDVDVVENNVTVTVVVDAMASGLVEFNIDGKSVYIVVNNGMAVYNVILPAGDYNTVVTYLGDSKFNSNSTSKEFTVTDHIKKNTTIISDVVVDGYNVTVTVNVDSNATGFVEFILAGNSIFAQVNDGKAVFNSYVLPGNYTIDAIYLGDDDFNANATVINFIVDEIPLKNTTIDVDVNTVENNVTITAVVDAMASGFVEFNIDGKSVCVVVNNGRAVYDVILPAGGYNVVVTYLGDDKFNSNSTSKEFTVTGHVKMNTTVSPDVVVDGYKVTITVTVDSNATGFVEFNIGGRQYYDSVNGGKAVLVAGFAAGRYMGNVHYLGDENFNDAMSLLYFNVEEEPVIVPIASEFTDIVIYDDLNISMVLKDGNGNVIPNVLIKYSVNGVLNNTTTLTDGSFVIKGENGAVITVVYDGNETIKGTNITVSLTPVVPVVVKVTHFDIPGGVITLNGYAVDTKAGEHGMTYATALLDEDGKAVVGVPMQFAVNDKIYNRVTDEKGSFTPYHLDMVRAGRYTMAFYFSGNDNYTSTFGSVCVDLDKKPITIKASAKSYKASVKTKSFTVTLSTKVCSSADGKAHLSSGKKVTLVVNGKTYSGKTNSKGQVTFKITNLSKKGVYTAKIGFAGSITYESATKSVKLTIK